MSIDPRQFRDAMGCFATAVTVVSTLTDDGRPVGVTVNSFNSVSLEPPLVLFSLGLEATNLAQFLNAGKFTINILNQDQRDISNGFAGSGDTYFGHIEFEQSDNGCPLVPGALAAFECTTETTHEGGDHMIFIGRVTRVLHNPDGDPLIYYRGRYAALT